MATLNNYQREEIKNERELAVFKRDDMIQKARVRLTVQEQRAVLYVISKIKPEDTSLTEYTFKIKDFYKVIGWEKQSYTEFKDMIKALSDRSWWAEIDDKGTESVIRWFTTAKTNKNSGEITVKFHEDMMPFLIDLVNQNTFYTSYNLKYILPMSSQFSPRLYEILKSYQKNKSEWFFDVEQLKYLMDCQNYKNYNDFKKRALDPAVEEINKYTDLCIAYDEKREGRGRRVARIVFFMDEKTKLEKESLDAQLEFELDGPEAFTSRYKEESGSSKTEFTKERAVAKIIDKKYNQL